MIIDFHTHIFPDKIAEKTISFLAEKSSTSPYTNGTVDGLNAQMKKANCDIAVALPVVTKPSQFDSVNAFAAAINEKFNAEKRGVISFGGIHPLCENIKEKMRQLKEKGFLGVKIHPDYQDAFIDCDGYIEILKSAKELDMIVVTHAGVDIGYIGQPVKCPPSLALKVIKKVGHGKFVLAHYGGHDQWTDVLDELAGQNVYFDTAFTLHEIDEKLFKQILEKHGADKILFASDCPWRDIEADKNTLLSYNLDKETQDKIFYKNALKLLFADECTFKSFGYKEK